MSLEVCCTARGGKHWEKLEKYLSELSSDLINDDLNEAGEEVQVELVHRILTAIESFFLSGYSYWHQGERDGGVLRRETDDDDHSSSPNLESSFWPLLAKIGHADVIGQVLSFGPKSDVHKCRLWIRVTLSDHTVNCYIDSMRHDVNLLRQYYREDACMFDASTHRRLAEIIQAFDDFHFKEEHFLAQDELTSCWGYTTLFLIDGVPECVNEDSRCCDSISVGGRTKMTLMTLKLQKEGASPLAQGHARSLSSPMGQLFISNRITSHSFWAGNDSGRPCSLSRQPPTASGTSSPSRYSTLDHLGHLKLAFDLASYQQLGREACLTQDQIDYLGTFLTEIALEVGVDKQGFRCNSCCNPISYDVSSYSVCRFTGRYYCRSCFHGSTSLVPSLVIHDGDLRPHPVCDWAKAYLEIVRTVPLFDLHHLNPTLPDVWPQLKELQDLQRRITLQCGIMRRCLPESRHLLDKTIWPHENLCVPGGHYSLQDLEDTVTQRLHKKLHRVERACSAHIKACSLCQEWGRHCAICNSGRRLFAFETRTAIACDKACGALLHRSCARSMRRCHVCN